MEQAVSAVAAALFAERFKRFWFQPA